MPQSVELFAGGGGMALGMRQAGFEHEQLVEWDARACEILRANAERDPDLWKPESVRQMDIHDWLAELDDLKLENIDLIAGGPPCQPFSFAGAHAGDSDGRNMFPAAIEAVRRLRPKLAVFENVPGLLRDSFRPYYDYIIDQLRNPEVTPREGETWAEHHRRVRAASERGLSYHVYIEILNAADIGVPQFRRRVFLILIRSDMPGATSWQGVPHTHSREALLYAQWMTDEYWDEHGLRRPGMIPEPHARRAKAFQASYRPRLLEPESKRWRTVRDGLNGLPEPIDEQDIPGVLNHGGIPGARTYRKHTGSWIDWPCKAIKAGVHGVCGGEAMILFNDESVRYLTVREAARMQSFPDSYEIRATRTAGMRAIGNAVAAAVAEAIGCKLRAHAQV